jgi:hypothetical protein
VNFLNSKLNILICKTVDQVSGVSSVTKDICGLSIQWAVAPHTFILLLKTL